MASARPRISTPRGRQGGRTSSTTIAARPVRATTDHSLNAHAQGGAMDDLTDPDPEVPERARGPRRSSASYKARILAEYERLDKAAKGALLRREGLYTSLISEWRKQRDRGALQALAKPAGRFQIAGKVAVSLRMSVAVEAAPLTVEDYEAVPNGQCAGR
jgi:transposase-like protein